VKTLAREEMSTRPPGGTRDFLPDDVRRREYVIEVVKEVYEQYGFEPLETPAFENVETLVGKYGEEGNRLIFKILRRGEHEASGEADLALRYDLTVPLARVVAQYQHELPRFFKRYQIQPVWRADRPARGRFREFYQCDIDAIGSTSPLVEVEIISAASTALTRLGFADFEVRLNHRQVLGALLGAAGVAASQQGDALTALDKLDKIGLAGVVAELEARGISAAAREWCQEFFASTTKAAFLRQRDSGSVRTANEEILLKLERAVGPDDQGRAAVDDLRGIVELSGHASSADRIRVDPSLARGLSYYTGTIIEIVVPDLAGSIGGGGRYDALVGMFLGRDVPACGFSLGLERIIVVMTERGMFPQAISAGADVMVSLWSESSRADTLTLATELRAERLRVEIYPEPDKLGRQLKYASSRGVALVAIVGDDERAQGQVSLKNLRTGEQWSVPRDRAAAAVRNVLVPNP
jgi:histidyl-tRNA synthetase